jgi:hypothetical protein
LEYLLFVRDQLLSIVGKVSFFISLAVYVTMLILLISQHMTFFDDGMGDLIIVGLMSCAMLLQVSLLFMATKHQLKWFYLPIIIIAFIFLSLAPRFIHPVTGQDNRLENLKALVPNPQKVPKSQPLNTL